MARSLGPILAAGGITLFNDVIVHTKTVQQDTKVVVGTAVAAGGLALLEHVSEDLAVGVSWLILLTVLLVRVDPKVPAPAEAISAWLK